VGSTPVALNGGKKMKKIMIVDDSMIVRMNLKRIFERNGYQVVAEAANGKDAIEKYTKYHPDLTTMDITMPVLDGISALQDIIALDSKACVVMISALGQERKIIEAVNKGARHFIVKPINEADVVKKIDGILSAGVEDTANASA
jgi:two-component system chemotaxis response regulator CheY